MTSEMESYYLHPNGWPVTDLTKDLKHLIPNDIEPFIKITTFGRGINRDFPKESIPLCYVLNLEYRDDSNHITTGVAIPDLSDNDRFEWVLKGAFEEILDALKEYKNGQAIDQNPQQASQERICTAR